jgi:hypothetical protein
MVKDTSAAGASVGLCVSATACNITVACGASIETSLGVTIIGTFVGVVGASVGRVVGKSVGWCVLPGGKGVGAEVGILVGTSVGMDDGWCV